jgi:putative membrane protein
MVSLLEHHVLVLPDRGIAQRVESSRWAELVEAVVTGLKANDIAGGFCAGIERLEGLLAQACPVRPGDNPDELPDRLIQEP